jgi:hypothetical protein
MRGFNLILVGNAVAIEGIVCHSIYSNSKPLISNRKFLKHFRKIGARE